MKKIEDFAGVSKNIHLDSGKVVNILCIVFEYLSRNKIVLKDLSDLSINELSNDTLETIKSISTQKFLNEIIKKINFNYARSKKKWCACRY